jgi:hypothetical protein
LPSQDTAKEYLPLKKSSPRSPYMYSTTDIKVVFDAMDSTTDAVDHPCGGGEEREGEGDPSETRVGVDCVAKGAQLQLNFCDDEAEKFGDTLGPPTEAGSTRAFRHCNLTSHASIVSSQPCRAREC